HLSPCIFSFFSSFFLYCNRDYRDLHSFPTRRSSDLVGKKLSILTMAILYIFAYGFVIYLALFKPYGSIIWLIALISAPFPIKARSEEHTSELQSRFDLVCRLLLEKKKNILKYHISKL